MSAADTAAPGPDFYLVARKRTQHCMELQIDLQHDGFRVGQRVQFRDELGDWITAEVRAFTCLPGYEVAALVMQTGDQRNPWTHLVPLGRLITEGPRK